MSSRQLRKLQKQRELEQAQESSNQEAGESSEDEAPVVAKPRVSLFAALGGDDEVQDEDEEEEQEPQVEERVSEVAQPASADKKKKKKKKKAKAKTAAAEVKLEDEEEDEIDKAIKALNINIKKTPEQTTTASQSSTRNALLSINPYHLKAMNEMRNLFDRDIMASAEADEETERNRPRRGPVQQQVDLETFLRGPPGQKKLPEVSLRRNIFIQGREHWPRSTSGGLTMKEVGKAQDGSWTEYAYIHDKDYDAVQACFFAFVQIGDPMRMVHLLKEVRKCSQRLFHYMFEMLTLQSLSCLNPPPGQQRSQAGPKHGSRGRTMRKGSLHLRTSHNIRLPSEHRARESPSRFPPSRKPTILARRISLHQESSPKGYVQNSTRVGEIALLP